MFTLTKSAILAVALVSVAGATASQAMSGDKVLDDLVRTGSIVTPHGMSGR